MLTCWSKVRSLLSGTPSGCAGSLRDRLAFRVKDSGDDADILRRIAFVRHFRANLHRSLARLES